MSESALPKSARPLRDWKDWVRLGKTEQDGVIQSIYQGLSAQFDFVQTNSYSPNESLRIAAFRHKSSELVFHLIPGGEFLIGLSEKEEAAARRLLGGSSLEVDVMRPVHRKVIRPFLISRFPVDETAAQQFIELDPTVIRTYDPIEGTVPLTVTHSEAMTLAKKMGLSIPSEAQWEFMCRATTTTLFYTGDELPSDEMLPRSLSLFIFNDDDVCEAGANMFGIVGTGVGEWCRDNFQPHYDPGRNDDLPLIINGSDEYVIRGGGAAFWPWQGCNEWIMCMSAHRSNSNWLDDAPNGVAAIRLLHQLT